LLQKGRRLAAFLFERVDGGDWLLPIIEKPTFAKLSHYVTGFSYLKLKYFV
jgi:hypothetical protein